MGKANEEVTVRFEIPNTACRFYSVPLSCIKDSKEHTCCKEECTLSEVVFGFKENKMKTHHEFENGVCIHCGDIKNDK